jgi:hypothetical protein
MPQDPQRVSPLGPVMADAVGFHDRRFDSAYGGPPEQGIAVPKGHAKDSMADPSLGTAVAPAQALERNGARFRVHPPHFMPNNPESAATEAAGRVVPPTAALSYDGDVAPEVAMVFDDAPVTAGYGPGHHRQRGYTTKG